MLTPQTPAQTFADLNLVATVQSVTIASPPVVNFTIKTNEGVPVVGFGSSGKCFIRNSTTVTYVPNCYPNIAFSLAKLVPSAGGVPSKWVSYIVATAPDTAKGSAPTTPSTDNYGTLVDNKDGTYKYTFFFDVPGMKALIDGMTVAAPNNKADLGDLTYDPNLTHRLTIQISGNAPGTGTNTPDGKQVVVGVPLKKAVDVIYDFVPATGQAPAASANRKMVAPENCDSCHSTLGGIPGDSAESSGAGFHGGSRNNVEYCVVCHTEQRRYGQTEIANCGSQAAGAACYDTATLTWVAGTSATTGPVNTRIVNGRAIGNMPNFVHKTHLGGILAKSGYNYAGVPFDKGGYSQDIRNCEKCHNPANPNTPQAGQWKTVPSRLACGSCHDGINFDTGVGVTLADAAKGLTTSTGFFGKAHPDNAADGGCSNSSCHGAGGGGDPELVHRPVTPANDKSFLHVADGSGNTNTNSAWIASNQNRLPEGAIKVEYVVKSVTLSASRNPVITFQIKLNGTVTPFLDFATAPVNTATGKKEMFANFMGAPSAYFVWAMPQDGIAKPADFNASASSYLRSLWNGTASGASAGTLVAGTGGDAGFYIATLTGVRVPETAVMVTGGIGYSYNNRCCMPLTQTNLPDYPTAPSPVAVGVSDKDALTTELLPSMPNATGGLIVIAKNVQKVAVSGCVGGQDAGCVNVGTSSSPSYVGYAGRRQIVSDDKCNACHQELGTFTEDAFHAGQRNDGTTCSWCHTPNRGSSAWTAETGNMTHAIHAGAKRNVPYTWHAISTTDYFGLINYPGILARCEQCHIAGSYDFANSASANAAGLGADGIDKRQFRTVGKGKYIGVAGNQVMGYKYDNVVGSPTFGTCIEDKLGTAQTAVGVFSLAPSSFTGMVYDAVGTTGTYYGFDYTPNVRTGASTPSCSANGTLIPSVAAGLAVEASPLTLVVSPTTVACVGCHDSSLAISHMKLNGGALYEARSTALGKVEQCFICHASGRLADVKAVHAR